MLLASAHTFATVSSSLRTAILAVQAKLWAIAMDVSASAPHVNRELLGHFVQRRVRLVGLVESLDGNSLRVKAADDGVVNVTLKQPGSFDDKYICVEGTVESPDTIIEDSHTNFGNNFGASQLRTQLSCCHGPGDGS